jgi:hypothetical protein
MRVADGGVVMGLVVLMSIIAPATVYGNPSKHTTLGDGTFIIQNTSYFIDEIDLMHVYGEVRNISNLSLTNVTISGSFYYGGGQLLNDYQRSCELPTINAGDVCPFEIVYIDTRTTDNVKDFKLSAQGIATNISKPTKLKLYSENSRLDVLGFYYINGRILNEGSVTATNSSVVATLYDNDGRVIAIGRALAEPVNIPPGSFANFGIAVSERLQTHKTESYSLTAFSSPYVSSPLPIVSK